MLKCDTFEWPGKLFIFWWVKCQHFQNKQNRICGTLFSLKGPNSLGSSCETNRILFFCPAFQRSMEIHKFDKRYQVDNIESRHQSFRCYLKTRWNFPLMNILPHTKIHSSNWIGNSWVKLNWVGPCLSSKRCYKHTPILLIVAY